MKLEKVALSLGISSINGENKLQLYRRVRQNFIRHFGAKYKDFYQSPSILPSTSRQRSTYQSEKEHSVYQRSDYTPIILEHSFNSLFPSLASIAPITLMFNSGMAAISSVVYFLYGHKKIRCLSAGENTLPTFMVSKAFCKFISF